jgi:hypothetical protein
MLSLVIYVSLCGFLARFADSASVIADGPERSVFGLALGIGPLQVELPSEIALQGSRGHRDDVIGLETYQAVELVFFNAVA